MWILLICLGINSWTGCGANIQTKFPDKDSCFEALKNVRTQEKGALATGEASSEFMAICVPY